MAVSTRNTPVDTARILIACSDSERAQLLAQFMAHGGHEIETCCDAQSVFRIVGRKRFDVVVLDIDLGDDVDIDLVSFVRHKAPQTQLILLFEMVQIDRALKGLRRGAFFYLPMASQPSDVALVVENALRRIRTESALSDFEQSVFEQMAGSGPGMRRVIELIVKVAPTDSTVLLLGESGTGKELLANAVHRLSPRRDKPFIAINCAALPENLLESEMFGHVKGSFTGAEADKRGFFEEADGGSIFLDEVGDMSPATQAKILRVLQNGEMRAVGSVTSKRVDVRVIAATNRDLAEDVRERRFREDLYFRLNVIQIRIPPLRERPDALPSLVGHFLDRFNARFGKDIHDIDEAAQVLLRNYRYPGNVRELENIIAHAVILCDGQTITPADLPDSIRQGVAPRLALPDHASGHTPTLQQMEEQLIRTTLQQVEGNQTEAAKRLGISRSTLWRKTKEYKIVSGADSQESQS